MAEKDQVITPFGRQTGTEWTGGAALIKPEPWMQDALCAETDPEAFFPEKGGTTRDAKALCGACDVRDQCLAYALRTRQEHGIWGGTSREERFAMWRTAA